MCTRCAPPDLDSAPRFSPLVVCAVMDEDREAKRIRALERELEAFKAEREATNAAAMKAIADKEAAEMKAEKAVADKEAAEVETANIRREKDKAVADKEAAEMKAEKAVADIRREKDKAIFMSALRGMAASASESSHVSADTARRGAPEPEEVPVELFFQGWPQIAAETIEASWQHCRRLLASFEPLAMPLDEALESLPERAFVHSVLLPLLCAMTADGELRLWHEATPADSVPLAEAKPDVVWTHARDMGPSSLGALLCAEIKRWGLLKLPLVRHAQIRHASVRCAQADAGWHCGAGIHADGELLAAPCWTPCS